MAGGFLGRLGRSRSGNTLAMMAAFLIPICALAGSAIDMSRLYLVKVRLQQACDAGVLAGRKFMADPNATALDANAVSQAKLFFANNFSSGWMGTTAFSATTNPYPFTPTKTSDNQVAGTATITVPMTLMRMFKSADQPITVTCMARYDIADTDVMFVLDTTGSMSCLPTDSTSCSTTATSYTRADGSTDYYNPEKNGSKLQAVRNAVQQFYETLAKNIDPTAHIRYGFVPYSSTVNVGAAIYGLSSSYLVSNWHYQSRHINTSNPENASTSTSTPSASSQNACNNYAYSRTPATGYDATGQAKKATASYTTSKYGSTCTVTTTTYQPNWTYEQTSWPVSSYLATINSGTIADPTKVTGATTSWQGCIEERDTSSGVNTWTGFNQSSLPPDLDPDLTPTSDSTRWRPQWGDVEYARYNTSNNGIGGFSSTSAYNATGESASAPDQAGNFGSTVTPDNPNYDNYTALNGGFAVCPQAASRLQSMTESQVMAYVNTLKPHGGTYHDIGMIWGTRMLSPNGIFKADTAAWPGRLPPNRVIVFLTDGQMAPDIRSYSAYGIEYFDQRVMGNNSSDPTDYHNARFLAECQAAKARNISVWVVAVGQSLTAPLQQCASNSNQALYAGNSADLSSAFVSIANAVAQLRITS